MKPFLPALAVALAAAGIAAAATDGTAGPDSTATVDMSLTVSNPAPLIQITGLQDFDFDTAPGVLPPTQSGSACVYVSEPGVKYSVIVSGSLLANVQRTLIYGYMIRGRDTARNVDVISFTRNVFSGTPRTFSGFTPSNTPGCTDGNSLIVHAELLAPVATITNGRLVKATVTMTVAPE